MDGVYSKMSEVLHLEQFIPYLNSVYSIRLQDGSLYKAELIEAAPLSNTDTLEDSEREPFSVVFKLEDGVELPQRLYDLTHPVAGAHALFLVPVHLPRSGHYLEAVFN